MVRPKRAVKIRLTSQQSTYGKDLAKPAEIQLDKKTMQSQNEIRNKIRLLDVR